MLVPVAVQLLGRNGNRHSSLIETMSGVQSGIAFDHSDIATVHLDVAQYCSSICIYRQKSLIPVTKKSSDRRRVARQDLNHESAR